MSYNQKLSIFILCISDIAATVWLSLFVIKGSCLNSYWGDNPFKTLIIAGVLPSMSLIKGSHTHSLGTDILCYNIIIATGIWCIVTLILGSWWQLLGILIPLYASIDATVSLSSFFIAGSSSLYKYIERTSVVSFGLSLSAYLIAGVLPLSS